MHDSDDAEERERCHREQPSLIATKKPSEFAQSNMKQSDWRSLPSTTRWIMSHQESVRRKASSLRLSKLLKFLDSLCKFHAAYENTRTPWNEFLWVKYAKSQRRAYKAIHALQSLFCSMKIHIFFLIRTCANISRWKKHLHYEMQTGTRFD